MTKNKFHLISYASGVGGADIHSGAGPLLVKKSAKIKQLSDAGIAIEWKDITLSQDAKGKRLDEIVAQSCLNLAEIVMPLVRRNEKLCVIGGDHSCAIGTWSGVSEALQDKGDLGLIWIDAHMDSHTPETSESGLIHGMPLACLLGFGYPTLTSIIRYGAKLLPQNVCLIGVRSYEKGEEELLKRLNVRIYFMDEIEKRGFATVMQEAVERVTRNTAGFGITIDVDGIDPLDAPGVAVPAAGGIRGNDLCESLRKLTADSRLLASEVVEFDPAQDVDGKTEKLVADIIEILVSG